MRAAGYVSRHHPAQARVLAAELRNAVTPASLAADQLGDDLGPGLGELGSDVHETVRHVLEVADALEGVTGPGPAQELAS